MRYSLEKDSNGRITQCDNADGNSNVYAQRKELNKIALENLQRPTPGKLGGLANLQIFNFTLDAGLSGTSRVSLTEYNTTVTTGNVGSCVQFGIDSLVGGKSLYYNIIDIKASIFLDGGGTLDILSDCFVEFYLTENIETSTSSLGRKIARRAPVFGSISAPASFTTDDAKTAYQSIKTSLTADSVNVPSELRGLRCSGLALKTIYLNLSDAEALADIRFNFQIFIDVSSVSSTY